MQRLLSSSAALALAVLLVFAARPARAAPAADEVFALPGWNDTLPSKIYSGFIDAGTDEQDGVVFDWRYWYMFVECEMDPANAPVLLFSNGGPGASSAFGLFTELGPFTLSDQSILTNPPTLFRNPYSFSKLANVLILNSPAPVGYSYCTPAGPSGNGTSCGSHNDTRTLVHTFAFVHNWFASFPEYVSNELFLMAESYAGVYLGQLTDALLNAHSPLNLKGIAMIDVCMGTEVLCGPVKEGPWHSLLFSAGQGCISLFTFESILALCPMQILVEGPMSSAPPACVAAVAKASVECPSNAYYDYNYLDQCPPSPFRAQGGDVPVPVQPSGYPCGGVDALMTWISLPAVKAALHVAPNAVFESFDNGEGFVYNVTWPSNLPLMRRLQTGVDGMRVLIINGETDPSISSIKSQAWTFGLGFPIEEAWRPWTFGNGSTVVAGSIVQWEGDFKHVTVRGSGHMVPGYKPYSAFLMLRNWLSQAPWPALPEAPPAKRDSVLPSATQF